MKPVFRMPSGLHIGAFGGSSMRTLRMTVPIALALALSGCVAAQNGVPSAGPNISTALTPDTPSPSETATKAATSETTATAEAATAETTALADTKKEQAPASKATEEVASAAKTKKAEPARNDSTTLFSALLKSNDAATSQKKTETPQADKPKKPRKSVVVRRKGPPSGLPGVRKRTTIFGIVTDNARNEDMDEPEEIASLPSQSRRGNFGLILQTKHVQVHCFPRSLVRILKRVERKFGRTPIVTSGYRSRAKNRRIRGARNSVHISCKAADIQVPGVSKWRLARYLRSVPGRGGVGTYCHTKSVHIDVGKKRDWNWRCRRKRRR